MSSKVAALVKNFFNTDADALCLVPGEKLYLMRGITKTVVGREVLSEESFRAVAAENEYSHNGCGSLLPVPCAGHVNAMVKGKRKKWVAFRT